MQSLNHVCANEWNMNRVCRFYSTYFNSKGTVKSEAIGYRMGCLMCFKSLTHELECHMDRRLPHRPTVR